MARESKNSGEAVNRSFPARVSGFFAGVKSEYSKIIFPNKTDVRKETIAAIVVSVIVGALIFGLDTVLKELLGLIL